MGFSAKSLQLQLNTFFSGYDDLNVYTFSIICPALTLRPSNDVDKCIYVINVKTKITVNDTPGYK